jgi:hypothetical protein
VQQNAAPQNGSGYTDVSTYLNANQQGGAQLGNQVAQNLNTGYNQVQSDIGNSVNTAQSAINSGYTPENTQLIQQVASNPTGAVNDPNQLSGFTGQLNDQYTGPTSWADQGTLAGEVQTAQQNANISNPGTANVLTQQVEQQLNPGQTSQGINSLDTLLLTGNPNAVNTVQQAAAPYAGLTDYLNQQGTNVGNAITGAQSNAAQASQDALNAFTGNNGTLTNLNNTINTTTQNQLTTDQQQQQQLATDLTNLEQQNGSIYDASQGLKNYTVGSLSPQDIATLGITQDQASQLQAALQQAGTSQYETGHNFGASSAVAPIDLTQYLQQNNPNTVVNAGSVATPQQYQEMAAINQLLGSKAPTQGEAINPLNAASAGIVTPSSLNNFNYQGALTAAQTTAANERAAAQQQANQLTAAADLAHAQSQHGGPFSSIGNFLNTAGSYLANPLSVVPQEINAAQKVTKKV